MEERLAKLEFMSIQNTEQIAKLFEISSKLNGEYFKAQLKNNDDDNKDEAVHEKLDMIVRKIDYTNGTVRFHTKVLLVVGAVVGTLLVVNGSSLVSFLSTIIK